MTSLSPTALTFEDVLRALSGPWTGTGNTFDQIAKRTGRDRSNLRRDLGKLVDQGLITGDSTLGWARTEAGTAALDAIDRANGFIPDGAIARFSLDRIDFNPDNPRKLVDQDALEGLADSIAESGDLLQPIVLYKASPGQLNRMLHAGERRVRACRLLRDQGRLPEALVKGLPFIEREASKAEALFIGLVENGQREDLSPWEDAQGLKAYKDRTGLSARQIAFKLGRAREGSETGVRDVQDKIRVAEQATAETIADYEAGRIRWEDLRDSVREARTLSPDARLAMIELRWKLTNHPVTTEDGQAWAVDDGYGYQDPAYRELTNLIETYVGKAEGVHCSMCRLTPQGQAWLDKAFRDDVEVALGHVTPMRLEHIRRTSGAAGRRIIRAATDEGFTTSWLNNLMVAAAIERRRNGEPEPQPPTAPAPAAPAESRALVAEDPAQPAKEPALTAAQELALVELKARIVRRQHVAYGGARVFYPMPAWAEALNYDFFQPTSDHTHTPRRNYIGLTIKAEAYLREKGLWVEGQPAEDLIRAARSKPGAWTPGPLALGEYATGWLSFRGMSERSAPAQTGQAAPTSPAAQDAVAGEDQPKPAPKPLLTLYVGDIVEKHAGGVTTYRLLSLLDDTGTRPVFRAQPIRKGKDYGSPCALGLIDIWAVVSSVARQDEPDAAA
ncbi:ParB/RepB/Spo0J family partition protein [Caulobacter sp. 3R27C2-B]|uniref:ParB/RepB/Spo0J family partition protein n=1 Tax=Caulobacter sp. 3R27C2-B TaxID=2502219 RepID=UPI0010F74049|nr:ParB/RepB/Spo0J family partition protein [Caulobacter sp. 3R27C2-B]